MGFLVVLEGEIIIFGWLFIRSVFFLLGIIVCRDMLFGLLIFLVMIFVCFGFSLKLLGGLLLFVSIFMVMFVWFFIRNDMWNFGGGDKLFVELSKSLLIFWVYFIFDVKCFSFFG